MSCHRGGDDTGFKHHVQLCRGKTAVYQINMVRALHDVNDVEKGSYLTDADGTNAPKQAFLGSMILTWKSHIQEWDQMGSYACSCKYIQTYTNIHINIAICQHPFGFSASTPC